MKYIFLLLFMVGCGNNVYYASCERIDTNGKKHPGYSYKTEWEDWCVCIPCSLAMRNNPSEGARRICIKLITESGK